MNWLFVAQYWHQIWSPKREPKTPNFLPRNPDTFQPNFEQNLTKKSKKLETRKRYCKYPKKTRPRAPNWQHKLATISPPARHTYSQEAQHTPPSTVAQTAATHTATGNAAVALPGHSQAFILGTSCFFWQFLLVPTLCNNFGFCLDYNFFAGWSVFFWPAGRILSPFLVPVLGTAFGPCFGYQIAPRYKDY